MSVYITTYTSILVAILTLFSMVSLQAKTAKQILMIALVMLREQIVHPSMEAVRIW